MSDTMDPEEMRRDPARDAKLVDDLRDKLASDDLAFALVLTVSRDRTRQLAVRVRAAACGVPHLLVAATSLTREVLPTLKAAEAKLRKIASRS